MRKVIVKPTGKVDGIAHLFCDVSSGRYFVRYKRGKIDRTATLHGLKSFAFSTLQRAADKAFRDLKAEVDRVLYTEPEKAPLSRKSPIELGQEKLTEAIDRLWTSRGVSPSRLRDLHRFCSGLALTTSRDARAIAEIDTHNQKTLEANYAAMPATATKQKALGSVSTVFTALITRGLHTGKAPMLSGAVIVPPTPRQNNEIDFKGACAIIRTIRADEATPVVMRKELELYVRLAIETGQRPIDLYLLDVSRIDSTGHYEFLSHKTGRFQRVLHLLSQDTRNLINEIVLMRGCTEYSHNWDKHHRQTGDSFNSFWSKSFSIYSHRLGKYTKKALGEDCIFYGLKDFFISQIFRHTENEFWAKAFTHEGRGANQKAYLFLDQDKADQILSKAILEPFAAAMLWELGAPEQTADKRDQDRLSQIMGEWDRLGEAAKHCKR